MSTVVGMPIKRWSCVVALASLAPACSSSSASTRAVTVTGDAPPQLIAYRDESSTGWIGVPIGGATTFDVTMHGAYQVVVACSLSSAVDHGIAISWFGRAGEDDPSIQGCMATPSFHLRGSLRQPGSVSLGTSTALVNAADSPFDLLVRRGTFDLILESSGAGSSPRSIGFRRDLAIDADKELGSIDLATEGPQPLIPVSYTIANLQPGETASLGQRITAGNTQAILDGLGTAPVGLTAQLAPDSVLRPTDRQRVTVSASTATDSSTGLSYERFVARDVRVGDPTSWTLPDALAPVTFDATADQMTVTWSTLPEHDEVDVAREGFPTANDPQSQLRLHEMFLSRAFLEATGATSATLDFRGIPGFQSDWLQDATSTEVRELLVVHHVSASETASVLVGGFRVAASSVGREPAKASSAGQRMPPSRVPGPDGAVSVSPLCKRLVVGTGNGM